MQNWTRLMESWADAAQEITDLRRIGFKGNLDVFTTMQGYHVSAQPDGEADLRKLKILEYIKQ